MSKYPWNEKQEVVAFWNSPTKIGEKGYNSCEEMSLKEKLFKHPNATDIIQSITMLMDYIENKMGPEDDHTS